MECRHGNFWIGLGIGSILGAVAYRLSRTAKAKQLESEIYNKTKTSAAHYFTCEESSHNTNNDIPYKAHIILLFYLTTAGTENSSVSQN